MLQSDICIRSLLVRKGWQCWWKSFRWKIDKSNDEEWRVHFISLEFKRQNECDVQNERETNKSLSKFVYNDTCSESTAAR